MSKTVAINLFQLDFQYWIFCFSCMYFNKVKKLMLMYVFLLKFIVSRKTFAYKTTTALWQTMRWLSYLNMIFLIYLFDIAETSLHSKVNNIFDVMLIIKKKKHAPFNFWMFIIINLSKVIFSTNLLKVDLCSAYKIAAQRSIKGSSAQSCEYLTKDAEDALA